MKKIDNSKRDEQIVKLFKEGKTKEEIAKLFNLSVVRIYGLLTRVYKVLEKGKKKSKFEKIEEKKEIIEREPTHFGESKFGESIICNWCDRKTDSFSFVVYKGKTLVKCETCINLRK